MTHHNAPFDLLHTPIHRLPITAFRVWFNVPRSRPIIGQQLAREYKREVLVGDPSCSIIARVDVKGAVHPLPFPYRKFFPHQASNRPTPKECACRHFHFSGIGGPWKDYTSDSHHPACEHEKDALQVVSVLMREDPTKVPPDRILQVQKLVRGL